MQFLMQAWTEIFIYHFERLKFADANFLHTTIDVYTSWYMAVDVSSSWRRQTFYVYIYHCRRLQMLTKRQKHFIYYFLRLQMLTLTKAETFHMWPWRSTVVHVDKGRKFFICNRGRLRLFSQTKVESSRRSFWARLILGKYNSEVFSKGNMSVYKRSAFTVIKIKWCIKRDTIV